MSQNAKIPNSYFRGGGGGRELVETNFQKSTSNFQSPVLSWNFHLGGGGNQFPTVNFKFSKSSPELKFPFGGEGGIGGNQFLTFDAESKFAKI